MSLNLKSSNSPFWHHYRKEGYKSRGLYLAETDSQHISGEYDEIKDTLSPAHTTDPYACMEAAIQKLDFYHKAILTDYYLNEMTYNTMNKKYGITLISLKKAVDTGIKLLQQHCKHFL